MITWFSYLVSEYLSGSFVFDLGLVIGTALANELLLITVLYVHNLNQGSFGEKLTSEGFGPIDN